MDEDGEVEMAEDSLASTLELIANAPEAPKSTVPTKGAVLPTPLQSYVGGNLDKVRWRSLGGGVKQSVLKTPSKATVRLLQIPAGAAMPDHGHRGTELTLVLKGAFRDEDGRFGRGDIEIANEDLHHTPVAEAGEDCICLAATDAPLRFRRLIPRMAQPFLGI
ncbi:MAG: ChrR family anti-sigma-E factor, partial [Boseongicola sp.]|nr:ChrR family anti-sigma-E factor [Boseongicola sp.]